MKSKSTLIPVSNLELVNALREVMPVGGDDPPRLIKAWPQARGWKKLVAEYPNGWVLRVNFNRHGEVTSSSATFRVTAKIHGRQGTAIIDEFCA